MKRILYSLVFLLTTSSLFATIRTVSNNPSTIAQFNTIQAAINASANGDTIYVHGSPTPYAGFLIEGKGLVLIGPGWRPDKNLPLRAEINSQARLRGPGASGTEFNGLVFLSTVLFDQNPNNLSQDAGTQNNIRLIRCEFRNFVNWGTSGPNGLTFQNHLIEGCFFSGITLQAVNTDFVYTNFLWRNNLFRNCQFSLFFRSNNFLLDHNLFYQSNFADIFSSCRFLTLTNNIFNEVSAAGASFSTFTNNLTFNTPNNTPWTINSNVDGGGNQSNVNPGIADQAAVDIGTDNPLLNFTIASGSANDAGTDGKDLGLLFDNVGSLNWANSRNSRLPRIFSMNITNATIAAGATLNVNINAKTSN